MRFGRLGTELKHGYNAMTTRESDMLMDIGYQLFDKNEVVEFEDPIQETAFVILTGEVEITWDGNTEKMHRESLFDQNPYCLHVPRGKKVVIKALTENAEVLVQQTVNEREFPSKFYRPEDVQADVFGQGMWNGTAERTVRTIFDYTNAPDANLVLGEVIGFPGKWSSYPPHHHPQPEIYYYKTNPENGFGYGELGDEVVKVQNNDTVFIQPGLTHPHCTAPGYALWYLWAIRHLDGQPYKNP